MTKRQCFSQFSTIRDMDIGRKRNGRANIWDQLITEYDRCFYEMRDGTFESTITFNETKAKIKCKCGKYMKTHLHEHSHHDKDGNAYGKSHYEIIATCNCENPEPDIMEFPSTESLDIALEDAIKAWNKVQMLVKEKEIFG